MHKINETIRAELLAGTYSPSELPSEIVGKGWCQGYITDYEDGNPVRWSMKGAGMHAWRTDLVGGFENQGFQDWEFTVHSVMPNGWRSSYQDWEDVPGRTQGEVVEMLQKAEVVMGLILAPTVATIVFNCGFAVSFSDVGTVVRMTVESRELWCWKCGKMEWYTISLTQ